MGFNVQSALLLLLSAFLCATQDVPFTPCPLLGPRFPIPRSTTGSAIVREGTQNLTDMLDAYLAAGDGEFGPITPNTTSFSIALFSIEQSNSIDPFFYQYHHSRQANENINAQTIYPVGDLTTLFTVWLFLIEAGEAYWSNPVSKWIPELTSNVEPNTTTLNRWNSVTLGDLAAHLGGIGRYSPDRKPLEPELATLFQWHENSPASPCETESKSCDRAQFLSFINKHAPAFSPASTPIFSNTGFILLAYALENIRGRPFSEMLTSSILLPLNMSSTSILATSMNHTSLFTIEAPYNGLHSSITDISIALRAILSSQLLPLAITNRWLKPVSHTSNRANSVGRPWEIFSLTVTDASPVIPIYQVRGNVGMYSSHVGLAPDYGVGFVVMAEDTVKNADLNAYVDMISVVMIPALEMNAISQADKAFAGTYKSDRGNDTVSLSIAQAKDFSPGLSLTTFTSGSKDLRAAYARMLHMKPEDLSFRLYPTDQANGRSVKFRAVFQDMSALADAGTPTCESWRYVDELQYKGVALDEFVFKVEGDEAVGVEVKALQLRLRKDMDSAYDTMRSR